MPRKMIVLRISCRYDTYIRISVISYRSFPFDFLTPVWRRIQSNGGRDCNHQSLTCITILRLRKPFVYQSFEFTLAANWFVVICVKRKKALCRTKFPLRWYNNKYIKHKFYWYRYAQKSIYDRNNHFHS